MALSYFEDKSNCPGADELARALGDAMQYWQELEQSINDTYPKVSSAWNFSGKKYGWSMRLLSKKRVVIYLTPQEGYFLTGLVLGDKAINKARDDGQVSGQAMDIVGQAPRYGEGTGVRFDVRNRDLLPDIMELVRCKMSF